LVPKGRGVTVACVGAGAGLGRNGHQDGVRVAAVHPSHALLTLALAAPLWAGCLTGGGDGADDGASGARLLCYEPQQVAVPWAGQGEEPVCNHWATVSPAARQANELSIAVNPLDADNIIATGKDYNPADAGDCVRDGIYVTHDGGRSWTNANVPGSPWRLLSDPASFELHPELTRYWCVTDPVVAFAPDGTAYWTVMPYQCDAASGSKLGDGVHPDGGANDWLWTCSSMYVFVSDDGGTTWPIVREVAFGPRLEHDKQWLSVAPDGTVLLCWDRDPSYQLTGLVPGTVQAAQLTAPGYMVCSTSTDRGRSWSAVTDVNPDGTWDGFLPWVDWDADNVAWMAALDSDGNVLVSRSPDGLAWDAPVVVGAYQNPPADGAFGWPALQGSVFRTFALPSLAVDRSGGPHSGTVYVAWMDHSGSDADILVTVSRDGATWSAPRAVHDDGRGSGVDQFMPAISVGPDGTVDMTWYDRRDDPANHLFDLYYTYSTDGGATWARDLRVSDVSSDEQFSHHQNGMVFLGDYIDLDSGDGRAYAIWVDTRNAKADAFIAVIERPGANG
jgi:hypothetical protein